MYVLPKKGLALVLISFFCFGAAGFVKGKRDSLTGKASLSETPQIIEKIEDSDFPARILIPKVKIDLPIFPGKAIDDKWEIAEKGVSYLMGSGIPGRVGNAVIYSHNKKIQFGPISWLKKGDEIKIINKKNEEIVYQVVETKIVSPKEIEVLSPTEDSTLTLYTCIGIMDSKRLVVIAKLRV